AGRRPCRGRADRATRRAWRPVLWPGRARDSWRSVRRRRSVRTMEGMEGLDRELRDWLVAHGATDELLARAATRPYPEGLASDLAIAQGASLSARDVADRSGLDLDTVTSVFRVLGVMVNDPDVRLFTEADVQLVSEL